MWSWTSFGSPQIREFNSTGRKLRALLKDYSTHRRNQKTYPRIQT